MKDFSGKVVALTGAASGIGRALAVRLGEEGADLALGDVDEAGLNETAKLVDRSPKVTTHVVDVGDRHAVEAFALAVERRHGGVDVIVNNAGVGCVATVEDATYEDFDWVIGVNLWGVIHGVKAFLPLLRKRPEAHIVNVASVNSFLPFPTSGPYNISKSGVEALSETLMEELSDTNVSVSCVYPGGVKTNISRNARHTSDEENVEFERRAMATPDQAARRIIRGIKKDRKRIVVGVDAKLMVIARRLSPLGTLRLVTWGWRRTLKGRSGHPTP
ncbi:MAG: SDR family NAD(P)-dependent oxidoreductase [Actinobacteria bacterium]|nr:SDR family NAD(P)-dependent oxidoreductase [Actinomycetota bacterium]